MKQVYDTYPSPLGDIQVILDDSGVAAVILTPEGWREWRRGGEPEPVRDPVRCREAVRQLVEYFHGERRAFTLPLSLRGPEFSRKVWQALTEIPYGETRHYAQIAAAVGNPKGCRAVGQANRRNPLPIFIPCHRVIGKDGSLTGYIGQGYLGMKEYLLRMEQGFINHASGFVATWTEATPRVSS